MSIAEFGIALGVPIARSVLGWLENAMADKKITPFEWKQLIATVIRVGTISTFAYIGFNGAGIEIDAISAAAASALFDMILMKFKKK